MKTYLSAFLVVFTTVALPAQTIAFTYQGRLNEAAGPASGLYDLRFTVFDAAAGGNAVSGVVTNAATSVSGGLFAVTLDFGAGIFTGAERWLEIGVRTNGSASFTTLESRQRLTSTPYAVTARHLTGVVSNSSLAGSYSNLVTLDNPANQFAGTFTGNGSGLSNVNAQTLGGLNSAAFWKLQGNDVAPGQFLGSTNNQALELRVNDTRALRIEPYGGAAPSLVGGYYQNTASGHHGAVIAGGGTGGSINIAQGNYAFVGAGHGSQAADYSAVVGGAYNVSPGLFSFIGSGEANTNQANYSFIGGGTNNVIAPGAVFAFVGGGALNRVTGAGGFIGGGGNNAVSNFNGVIGGGANNVVVENAGVVAGGSENRAVADHSTVGGGQGNAATGVYGTVGGGAGNVAAGVGAFIGGGGDPSFGFPGNMALGGQSAIGGGSGNTAGGFASTVPGGAGNSAAGDYSLAAGLDAKANHRGSFVWADTQFTDFASTANNQFLIRASGGVGIGTTAPQQLLHLNVASGQGEGMRIDSGIAGHSPAVYLNHTGFGGHNFRIASYGDNISEGSFVIRDDTIGLDRLTIDAEGRTTVANSVFGGGITLDAGLNPAAYYLSDASVERAAFAYANGPGAYSSDAVAGDIVLRSFNSKLLLQSGSGGAALTISSDNKVGIGTTAPLKTLDVRDGPATNSGNIHVGGPFANGDPKLIHFGDIYAASGKGFVAIGENGADDRMELTASTFVFQNVTGTDSSGNVGIGVVPGFGNRLHVGLGGVRCEMGLNQKFSLGGNGSFEIDAPGFVGGRFIVTDGGRVGMGRIPTSNRLEVEGEASKTTAGSWAANSDRRIKKDIETITNALEKLARVRLASFRYTDEYRKEHPGIEDRKYLNVIAQEFQQVFPEAVKSSGDKLASGDEILQVDTYPLTIYSAAAVQELNQKLTQELKRRDTENADLQQRLAALEKLVERLRQKSD